MFKVEFLADTELELLSPPYGVYFEKGDIIEAKEWKVDPTFNDMIIVKTLDYGDIPIFNESVKISAKKQVHP